MMEFLKQSFYPLTMSSASETPLSNEMSSSYSLRSTSYEETAPDVRVGAFNVRVFGQSKAAKEDVMKILVQVFQQFP